MLPVTIFTVMMNNCQQDAKSSYFMSFFLSLLWNLLMGGGGEKKTTVAPKIPRVVFLPHPCTFRRSSEFRLEEQGNQPEFLRAGGGEGGGGRKKKQ